MSPRIVRLLTRLYPRHWRERYGAEFEHFLQSGRSDLPTLADVVVSAIRERVIPTRRNQMNENEPVIAGPSFTTMMKHPSAFLPVAMSLTALTVLLVHIAIFGVAREADEGPTAHIWQLLMAGQLPVLAFFAIKWLPKAPRQTLPVMALQAGAALASLAPVFFLGL